VAILDSFAVTGRSSREIIHDRIVLVHLDQSIAAASLGVRPLLIVVKVFLPQPGDARDSAAPARQRRDKRHRGDVYRYDPFPP
jgi:hypothetical protein